MVARKALRAALRPRGRPVVYEAGIAKAILSRIEAGETLRAICRDPDMPPESTVREWVRYDRGAVEGPNGREGFAAQYSRARESCADSIAEEILEISDESILFNDEPNNALVQHARLRSENRRWLLSKISPKRYGDKVTTEVTGADGGQLITRIELIPVDPRPDPRAIEHEPDGTLAGTLKPKP